MATNQPRADANLPELRQRITDLVARNAVAMVQCAIDGVLEEGQYQAIKYLFEMIGIYPAASGEAETPEDGLSRILLRHLGADPEDAEHSAASGEDALHPVK